MGKYSTIINVGMAGVMLSAAGIAIVDDSALYDPGNSPMKMSFVASSTSANSASPTFIVMQNTLLGDEIEFQQAQPLKPTLRFPTEVSSRSST